VVSNTGSPAASATYNKAQVLPPASADLNVVRQAIRIDRNVFSLSEKKKGKKILTKRIPLRLLSLPNRRLRSTRNRTDAVVSNTGSPAASGAYNKAQVLPPASADLNDVRQAIRIDRNAFSLWEKRRKKY
jgi:hypothetical protein